MNPNKPDNNSAENTETGWEGVAEKAGKMDMDSSQRESEQTVLESEEARQEKLDALRDAIKEQAKPATTPEEEPTQPESKEKELETRILQGPLTNRQTQAFYSEALVVQSLLKDKDEIDRTPALERSKADRKAYQGIITELKRHGYYDDGGKQSSTFIALKDFNKVLPTNPKSLELLMKTRQLHEELLYEYTHDENGKECRDAMKALKKAGFKKMPNSFDDENFTAHEITTMMQLAKAASKK